MNPFLKVIESLNRHHVRYVIVGGFAAVMHGNNRFTKDLDLVVDLEPAESRKAIAALQAVGMQCRVPVDPVLFADAAQRRRWREEKGAMVFTMIDPNERVFAVDLFLDYPAEFEGLLSRAERITLQNQTFLICGIDDLIAMKRQAGRPQDLLDIEGLSLLKSRKPDGKNHA